MKEIRENNINKTLKPKFGVGVKILSIETSCDDTGIAILEIQNSKFKVKSNVVSSQIEIHKPYGGVFPMMAKREHQKNLVPVLIKALKQAELLNKKSKIKNQNDILKIKDILKKEEELFMPLEKFLSRYEKPDVDLIAVTYGPGLEPCLWVGVNFAKALSYFWNIPVIPVNHIEAHILVNFLQNKKIKFPLISLVASGGHTQLILMKKIGKYKIIGETRDDAAGECFDKCAKILGLEYPGGPIISKIASQKKLGPASLNSALVSKINLPRPMINTKDYDFSFSGLKTAVLYLNKKSKIKNQKYLQMMCFEIQQAIIDTLIKKTIRAAKDFEVKTIILGGGVSANNELRRQLKLKVKSEKLKVNTIFPEKHLSTDNALMIAIAGFFHKGKKIDWKKLRAQANLRINRKQSG